MRLIALVLITSFFSLHANDYSVQEAIYKQDSTKMVALGTEISYEDSNLYFSFIPRFQWTIKAFKITLEKPIRLLVWNHTNSVAVSASVFPKVDWDDVRDYIQIIDNFEYGNRGDLLHIRMSSVKNYSLGVASSISAYRNNILFRFLVAR